MTRPSPMLPAVPPRLARTLAVLFVLAGLFELVFGLTLPGRLPSEAELAQAAARIRGQAVPGDAILPIPSWAEEVRLFDPGVPVRALPPDDPYLTDDRRLWVVALPEAPRAGYRRARATLEARFGPPELEERLGALTLLRYRIPGPPVIHRFRDQLASASVRLDEAPCRWTPGHRGGARWQCPRGGWNTVTAQVRELDYLPRECMWAHPVAGRPLVITFPDVPLRGELVVRGGIIGEAALGGGAPVEVAVEVAGRALGSLHVPPAPGFPERVLPLPDGAGRGPVRFTVTTPDDGRRHFCFDAFVRAPEPVDG